MLQSLPGELSCEAKSASLSISTWLLQSQLEKVNEFTPPLRSLTCFTKR